MNFLPFVSPPSVVVADPSTASENFLPVAATPLATFECFVSVPEAVFVSFLLVSASSSTVSGSFLRVAENPPIVFLIVRFAFGSLLRVDLASCLKR